MNAVLCGLSLAYENLSSTTFRENLAAIGGLSPYWPRSLFCLSDDKDEPNPNQLVGPDIVLDHGVLMNSPGQDLTTAPS
jgi:hypothetical protein